MLFVGATNLIPPVSTSSLAAGRHNRKNQLHRRPKYCCPVLGTTLRDEILKLKQEQGKNILVGGVDVPSQLMELGLIDEYRFVVMPTIVGEGRRLMEGVSLPEKLQLKLIESKPFKSGCVALRYLKQ